MVTGIADASMNAAAAMKRATGINKDDFLKLFITQLKNQDPLNPRDSAEFIAQLAQLTQVEQAYNTNSNLEKLLSTINTNAGLNSVSFIGKEVVTEGNQVSLKAGTPVKLGFRLDHQASEVKIEIMNGAGMTVRTLHGGAASAGDSALVWDGRDSANNPMPPGTYTYSVKAVNGDGKEFTAQPLMTGRVDGVRFQGGEPVLTMGGTEVPLARVLSVKGVS